MNDENGIAGPPSVDPSPHGIPAVSSSDIEVRSETLGNAGEKKKNGQFALVAQHARAFLEAVRDGTLERLKREDLFGKMTEVVFSYWAARLHHPTALLDRKRERRVMARLRESGGDWGLLCFAVDGALLDDWLMGRDVHSPRRYDGIETIFRDRAQVERLAEACRDFRAGKPHPLVLKYQHTNGNGDAAATSAHD